MIVYTESKAAAILGISKTAVRNRIKKAGLTSPLSEEELASIRIWPRRGNPKIAELNRKRK